MCCESGAKCLSSCEDDVRPDGSSSRVRVIISSILSVERCHRINLVNNRIQGILHNSTIVNLLSVIPVCLFPICLFCVFYIGRGIKSAAKGKIRDYLTFLFVL